MSKQNSSLISHRISTPLGKDEATHLDALSLGVQLAQGRAPDEVLNLLADELRTKIVSLCGKRDLRELPISYGCFDEEGDGDVRRVFSSYYADCYFRVEKNHDWLALFAYMGVYIPLSENFSISDWFDPYKPLRLIAIPCAAFSHTLYAELGHLFCDIAQQLALIKPDSQAA